MMQDSIMKSHTGFRLALTSMTSNDLERRNDCRRALSLSLLRRQQQATKVICFPVARSAVCASVDRLLTLISRDAVSRYSVEVFQ